MTAPREPRLLLYRKRGIYYVRVTWPDGRRKAFSLRVDDEPAARAALRLFEAETLPILIEDWQRKPALEPAQPPDPTPRLRDISSYYLDVALPNKGAAERTLASARAKLEDFTAWCSMRHIGRVSQLSRKTLDGYTTTLRERGLSSTSIGNYLAMIRAAYNAAVDGERLDANPFTRIRLPKRRDTEINPLTADQLRAVLAVIRDREPRIAPVVRWIAYTGNRPSDAVALQWRQVRLPERIVERTQQKSRRLAQYQISERAAALLEAQPRTGPLVFPDADGDVMRLNMLYRRFTRALERAGFERPVNLKDLRHTFGSLLANGSPPCPLPVLQVLMGHADIATTMRYVHASDAYDYVNALAATIGDGP